MLQPCSSAHAVLARHRVGFICLAALTSAHWLVAGAAGCTCDDSPPDALAATVYLPGFDFDGTQAMEVTWHEQTVQFTCEVPGESSGYTEARRCSAPPDTPCGLTVTCEFRRLELRDFSRKPKMSWSNHHEVLLFRPAPDAPVHEIDLVFEQWTGNSGFGCRDDYGSGWFTGQDLSWADSGSGAAAP